MSKWRMECRQYPGRMSQIKFIFISSSMWPDESMCWRSNHGNALSQASPDTRDKPPDDTVTAIGTPHSPTPTHFFFLFVFNSNVEMSTCCFVFCNLTRNFLLTYTTHGDCRTTWLCPHISGSDQVKTWISFVSLVVQILGIFRCASRSRAIILWQAQMRMACSYLSHTA